MKKPIFSKPGSGKLTLLILAVLWSTALVWGQGGPHPDAPRWGRERIETVIIGKFASELELTPEQAEVFFPRLREFQRQTENVQREQGDHRKQLDGLAHDPNADPQDVNRLLTQQSAHEQQVSAMKGQFLKDLSGVLTPQQVSRCAILLDELPRRVHQFIEEQRKGPHYGPGPRHESPPSKHQGQQRKQPVPPEQDSKAKTDAKDSKKAR